MFPWRQGLSCFRSIDEYINRTALVVQESDDVMCVSPKRHTGSEIEAPYVGIKTTLRAVRIDAAVVGETAQEKVFARWGDIWKCPRAGEVTLRDVFRVINARVTEVSDILCIERHFAFGSRALKGYLWSECL